MPTLFTILAVLLALSAPALALPDKIALAYPISDIQVDGDLSDWPDDLSRYPIRANDDGFPLQGEDDFTGHFRVGYSADENALYLAVEIEDDHVVRDQHAKGPDWNRRDGCELYLFGHIPGETAPTQYFMRGNERGHFGPGAADDAVVHVRWADNAYQYEWRVDFNRTSGQRIALAPDIHLGFDLSLWDRDRDERPSWMAWSRGTGKYQRADRLGTLVLIDSEPTPAQMLDLVSSLKDGTINTARLASQISSGYQMFFSGVLMAITFLHLLLFVFNRETRANLFYALYTAAIGAAIFSGLQLEFRPYINLELIRTFKNLAILVISLFGLAFLYSLYRPRPPKRFWFLLVFVILPTVAGIVSLMLSDDVVLPTNLAVVILGTRAALNFLNIIVLVEIVLVLIRAVRNKMEGAWIIGAGFIIFAANLNPLIAQTDVDTTALYWVLIPLVAMSVYLARTVASTNRELETRLNQVQELSAKTQEQYEQIQQQNRQLAREHAVERVRAEALSMRNSEDLRRVLAVMYQELLRANTSWGWCEIYFVDAEASQVVHYIATTNLEQLGYARLPESMWRFNDEIIAWRHDAMQLGDWPALHAWARQSPYSSEPDDRKETEAQLQRIGIEQITPEFASYLDENTRRFNFPFERGMIVLGQRQDATEEDIEWVKLFSEALALGFLRFKDFQQLEAQNQVLETANIQIQEANRLKSDFLARMSHDLRTPMNAIIGYTRILLRRSKDVLEPRQYRNLENVQLSANNLLALINDILDLSKIEADRIDLKAEPVDLKAVATECAASVESLLKEGVELKLELEDLPPLHTDEDRIRRVLVNLLSNAVKFTEAGHVAISLKAVDGWTELAVADTGTGIPAEDLPHIFDEFRQVDDKNGKRKEGTGLGLAIVKKSVELLGGTIEVQSTEGEGSTFALRLRDYEATDEAATAESAARQN